MTQPQEQTAPLLGDVIYNPATRAFEALVTLQTSTGPTRYAVSYRAPMNMDPDRAAEGLIARAKRLSNSNRALRASRLPDPAPIKPIPAWVQHVRDRLAA